MKKYPVFIFSLLFIVPLSSLAFDLDFGKILETTKKLKQLKPVSEKGEQKIGADVAANILGASPLVDDTALQKYVNQVGMWIALHSEKPNLSWRFGVLDTSSINAFSAPGGYIFVTRGLLLVMRNEAELAGVLAHEVSHVTQKHVIKTRRTGALVGLLADAHNESGDDSAENQTLKKAVSASTEVYTRGLDKRDEYESDRMGMVIAARAGYDPFGLPTVLQSLSAINPKDSAVALMFKTHPDPEKRLDKVMNAAGDRLDKYAGQQRGEKRFAKIMQAHVTRYSKISE
jgi:predicted Zn-dependent protease